MWTDTGESAPGTVTQVRALGAGADPFRQELRRRAHSRRSCHQGRPDRGSPRRRAHGRCRAVVRGRRLAAVPHPARGQEPFRPDRRDRRVRNDRRWACAKSHNPSELFLSERDLGSPGTAVLPAWRARRPLLVEIQALVAPTSLGTPRRAVVGWDPSRLSMVIAVLEAQCGVKLGGVTAFTLMSPAACASSGPAADLAAAAALVSSLANSPLPADAVYIRRGVALRRDPAGLAYVEPARGIREARLHPRREFLRRRATSR